METHDDPAGERPEEPHSGTSAGAEPLPDAPPASDTSHSGSGQAWPPPGRQPTDQPAYGAQPGPAGYAAPGGGHEQGAQAGSPGYATPAGSAEQGAQAGSPGYATPAGSAEQGAPAGSPGYAPAGSPEYGLPTAEHGGPVASQPPGWWTPRRKVAAGGAALALVLGGGLAGGAVAAVIGHDTTYASPTAVQPATNKSATGIAAIATAVQPSVVSITVTTQMGQGEGSGVVLRSDGTILTNNHVVADAGQGGQMTVKFSDGKKASASVLGTDPATDLAVIKADGVSGLKPATFGSSDRLQVGDPVVAIGSPLGLEGSVTSGIVSALHRTLSEGSGDQQQLPQFPGQQQQQQGGSGGTTIGDAIQTDAAINPGNSGGPLVNSYGQVIGVNTAIATSGGGNGNIGVGFAIPIDTAKQVADQLIKSGKATHAYLGVTLSDAMGGQQGALVASVQTGTPAAKSGLQEGDIVTQVDGKAIDGADTLSAVIRGHHPGDKITLTYVRNGQKHTANISLASSSGT
jgi:putative serine protease PepD